MTSKRKHRHFAGYVLEWLGETIIGCLTGTFGALLLWVGGYLIIHIAGFFGIPMMFKLQEHGASSLEVLLFMAGIFGFVGFIVGSNHGILKIFQLSKPMYFVVGFTLGAVQGGILAKLLFIRAGPDMTPIIFGAIFGGVFGAFADKIMKQRDTKHENQIKT
jgi:hypothetical protein